MSFFLLLFLYTNAHKNVCIIIWAMAKESRNLLMNKVVVIVIVTIESTTKWSTKWNNKKKMRISIHKMCNRLLSQIIHVFFLLCTVPCLKLLNGWTNSRRCRYLTHTHTQPSANVRRLQIHIYTDGNSIGNLWVRSQFCALRSSQGNHYNSAIRWIRWNGGGLIGGRAM